MSFLKHGLAHYAKFVREKWRFKGLPPNALNNIGNKGFGDIARH